MSPLGAYDAGSDRVLILDVARYKYPPHWVPTAALFDAMAAPAGSASRGWLVASVPPGGSALPPGGPPPPSPVLNLTAMRECAAGGDPAIIQLCIATGGAGLPRPAPGPATASPASPAGGAAGGGATAARVPGSGTSDGGGGGGGIWAAWVLAAGLAATSAALAYELKRERAAAAAAAGGSSRRGDLPLLPEEGGV
jgi:hypothetical protein